MVDHADRDPPPEIVGLFEAVRPSLEPALRGALYVTEPAIVVDLRPGFPEVRTHALVVANAMLRPLGVQLRAASFGTTVVVVADEGVRAFGLVAWVGAAC